MHLPDEEKYNTGFAAAEEFILSRLRAELPATLSYHGIHHIDDVMEAAMQIADAENIPSEDRLMLRIGVAFHDAGFIYVYKDHEEKGCEMAKEILPLFEFSANQVETVCGMIMATKIPQQPATKLEEIMADADLDYLGRSDVHHIAGTLFNELKIHTSLADEHTWNEIQIQFLQSHQYHTPYSIAHRKPAKDKYLHELMNNLRN